MPPYDLVRHVDAFGAALRAGAAYAFEHRLAGRPDDEWYLTQAVPVGTGPEPAWLGTLTAREDVRPHATDATDATDAADSNDANDSTDPTDFTDSTDHPVGVDAIDAIDAIDEVDPVTPLGVGPSARVSASDVVTPAELPGLRLETIAGPGAAARGLWYDAFARADGRLVLAVGQVLGPEPGPVGPEPGPADHAGVPDLIVLLRGAIRGAAHAPSAPDVILAAAEAALARATPARAVRALVAVYDPRTGLLDHASAGHPPALLHDGTAPVALRAVQRPPLGCPARAGAEVRTVRIEPGARLLLQAGSWPDPDGAADAGPEADPVAAWARSSGARAGAPGEAVILLLCRDLDGPGPA